MQLIPRVPDSSARVRGLSKDSPTRLRPRRPPTRGHQQTLVLYRSTMVVLHRTHSGCSTGSGGRDVLCTLWLYHSTTVVLMVVYQ